MEKTNQTDFELFKITFEAYQKLFGLNGYSVYFKLDDIGDCFADITTNVVDMLATIRLGKQTESEHIEPSAKHEAIHLLLARLVHYAHERFVSKDDIDSATEEAVRKLDKLIPNLPKPTFDSSEAPSGRPDATEKKRKFASEPPLEF